MKFEFTENENSHITNEQISSLEDLLKISDEIRKGLGLRFSPMQLSGSNIRFNGIVANIRFNEIELIVRPKVAGNYYGHTSVDSMMKTLYLRILQTCKSNLNSVVYFTGMATETVTDSTFIDCVAQYYLEKLMFALQKLPIVVYYQREEKRTSIKGKILIQKELKSPIRDGKTWCRYKVLSKDNLYNALLKWCCDFFGDNVSSKSLRFKLNMLSESLEGKTECLTEQSVRTMNLQRNFNVYREPFTIAREIYLYNNQNTKLRTGGSSICGYVINMEKAFENIVCYYVDRYASKKQMIHVSQQNTLFAKADTRHANINYYIRPDDLLIKGTDKLILDAKYKQVLDEDKPARDDFYQMISSCIAHETNEAILIYPFAKAKDDYSESWTVLNPINGQQIKVYAEKIDFFADDQIIIEQIGRAVHKSHFAEVTCGRL